MNYKFPLVLDTINLADLKALAKWLISKPHLTKGPVSQAFEKQFAKWQGCRYAHYVNSGSSANLLAVNALLISGRLKVGDTVIAPAVSWTTTVAPLTQLGLKPLLCDCNPDNLGLSIDHLEQLITRSRVKAIIICHVLGIPNHLDAIIKLCRRHKLNLIEDCCEALGSQYHGTKVGNFGDLSTFSFYFGHHMSTIEGGMVCTDSRLLSNLLRSLRSHGWNRDLDQNFKAKLRRRYQIDAFADQYTFYHPGYNFRGTDLGAFLGLRQLKRLNRIIARRHKVWQYYIKYAPPHAWLPQPPQNSFVSGFAYPLLSVNRAAIARRLKRYGVETRPLVCGSLGRQPWFIDRYGSVKLQNADTIHQQGLYVPSNPDMTLSQVKFIMELTHA